MLRGHCTTIASLGIMLVNLRRGNPASADTRKVSSSGGLGEEAKM